MVSLIIAALLCPPTIVYNLTDEAWTNNDEITLEFAKTRCKVHYKNSPCLKQFKKISTQNYHAICGKQE